MLIGRPRNPTKTIANILLPWADIPQLNHPLLRQHPIPRQHTPRDIGRHDGRDKVPRQLSTQLGAAHIPTRTRPLMIGEIPRHVATPLRTPLLETPTTKVQAARRRRIMDRKPHLLMRHLRRLIGART